MKDLLVMFELLRNFSGLKNANIPTSSICLSVRLKGITPSIFTNKLTLGKSIANLCTKLIL